MDKHPEYNPIIREYLDYLLTVKGYSRHTLDSYEYDLVWLFRYLKIRNGSAGEQIGTVYRTDGTGHPDYTTIDISDIDTDDLKAVRFPDLYAFLGFCARELGNDEASRKRKVTAVKGFFRFLVQIRRYLTEDPSAELEAPKLGKHQPRYLTLEQAQDLLDAVSGRHAVRDRAILTMFLNTGMRVSELCGLKTTDIQSDTLHITGKGNKDRVLFMNDACLQALSAWLPQRAAMLDKSASRSDYVFLSQKGGQFTNRGVEYLVEKYVMKIGLDPRQCTVHTLRHTAATLMHKYGEVDIRTLQAVLGHESTQTTEIYTHLDSGELQKAMVSNPLASFETTDDADLSADLDLNKNKNLNKH